MSEKTADLANSLTITELLSATDYYLYAQSIDGLTDYKVKKSEVVKLIGGRYKVYVALLTQAGIAAPAATIIGENTIGAIVWTRAGVGNYLGTLLGAFTANKTWLPHPGLGLNNQAPNAFQRIDDDTINLKTNATDDILAETAIEIRIGQ